MFMQLLKMYYHFVVFKGNIAFICNSDKRDAENQKTTKETLKSHKQCSRKYYKSIIRKQILFYYFDKTTDKRDAAFCLRT